MIIHVTGIYMSTLYPAHSFNSASVLHLELTIHYQYGDQTCETASCLLLFYSQHYPKHCLLRTPKLQIIYISCTELLMCPAGKKIIQPLSDGMVHHKPAYITNNPVIASPVWYGPNQGYKSSCAKTALATRWSLLQIKRTNLIYGLLLQASCLKV